MMRVSKNSARYATAYSRLTTGFCAELSDSRPSPPSHLPRGAREEKTPIQRRPQLMPSPLAGEGGAQRRVRGLTGHSIWQRSLARSFSQLFQQGFEFAGVQRPGEVKQEEGAQGETDEGQRDAVEISDPARCHDPGHDRERRQPEDEADAQLEKARTHMGALSG